jgi:SAM-dependent methyltransferase
MDERNAANERARQFFESLWKRGDPWELETSEFERAKYDEEISILGARRYVRALEIACGIGSFTRRLAAHCDEVLGVDVSPTAITRARETVKDSGKVRFREANIIEFDIQAEGPWDLVVMNETIYYLGWLYSFFDVAWLAFQLFESTRAGGQLLMANTCGGVEDYLLRPWIIGTYHDLFSNVGYETTRRQMFRGVKNDTEIDYMISLFTKPDPEHS